MGDWTVGIPRGQGAARAPERTAALGCRGGPGRRLTGPIWVVAGQPLRIHWAGEGNLGDVRAVAARRKALPDVIVARRLSPARRQLLSEAGIGWVDETGAAEIAIGTLVVSRTGRPQPAEGLKGWTPAACCQPRSLTLVWSGSVSLGGRGW